MESPHGDNKPDMCVCSCLNRQQQKITLNMKMNMPMPSTMTYTLSGRRQMSSSDISQSECCNPRPQRQPTHTQTYTQLFKSVKHCTKTKQEKQSFSTPTHLVPREFWVISYVQTNRNYRGITSNKPPFGLQRSHMCAVCIIFVCK